MAPNLLPAKAKEDGVLTHEPLAKSSVFDNRVPSKRFNRQLSHSQVGLSGNSPFHPHIRKLSPTRERRCRKKLEEVVQGDDVRSLWRHYMDLEAKPLNNRELAKVGHRLANLLVKNLASANDSGDKEALKKAVAAADGKLQIINLGGLKELKMAKKALGMDPETLPDPYAIAGDNVAAIASPKENNNQPLMQKARSANAKEGPGSLNTTATLENGIAEEVAEDEEEEALDEEEVAAEEEVVEDEGEEEEEGGGEEEVEEEAF